MQPSTIIFFSLLAFLVCIVTSHAQDDQSLCEATKCVNDCYEQGRHGECDQDNVCSCQYCIFRACRKLCRKQHRIGQCDESNCLCL